MAIWMEANTNQAQRHPTNRLCEGAFLSRGRPTKPIVPAFLLLVLTACAGSVPETLSPDPTPEAYAAFVGGHATVTPADRYVLDGQHVTCGTAPTVLDPQLNDYAMSFPKFIIVRPDMMAKPATPVKLWIYYHECGHVVRGPDTNAADCYGIERGVREGWFTAQAMDQVCDFIRPGIADASHLSGTERCDLMRACYANATRGSASR
jgi:hypothetical protein